MHSNWFPNLTRYVKASVDLYAQNWRGWVMPMSIYALVCLATALCCGLPLLLLAGPLSCGLFVCALATLRGRPFDYHALWQDWPAAQNALLAWLTVQAGALLPAVLACGVPYLMSLAAIRLFGGGQGGAGPGFFLILVMLVCVALIVVGVLLAVVWALYFNTRTMFVMPLVADRKLDYREAFARSWQATKQNLLEPLAVQIAASVIGGLGFYLLGVGIFISMPLYFLIVGTAYQSRFAASADDGFDTSESRRGGS